MTNRRDIIDRIEKLYALASGGTSPGEATAAISMAEKLARKHGIRDSEINKHTYTRGTSSSTSHRRRPEEPKQQRRSYSYRGFWEEYANNWDEGTRRSSRQQDEDFRRQYYHQTFGHRFVRADYIRESEKAYLINVHLDESKYPWTHVKPITVSVWIPKSQVTTYINGVWLLNEELLKRNLSNNLPWLRQHHPVFGGRNEDIVFHLKEAI